LIRSRDEQRRGWKELRSILLKEARRGCTHCDNQIEIATSKESTNVVYQRGFLGRLRQPCHLKRGFVEIDRCATDAVPIVTGCRLGKRALKFRDFGKVAATFCDLQEDRAVRVVAKESSKQRAKEMYPEMQDKNAQQMRAYREMPEAELFDIQWVRVRLGPEDMPGYKSPRVVCTECGEGINFKREVIRDGKTLCRACAGERYYEPV
jgi:formylmethanofuran dehydrogenase subunit E